MGPAKGQVFMPPQETSLSARTQAIVPRVLINPAEATAPLAAAAAAGAGPTPLRPQPSSPPLPPPPRPRGGVPRRLLVHLMATGTLEELHIIVRNRMYLVSRVEPVGSAVQSALTSRHSCKTIPCQDAPSQHGVLTCAPEFLAQTSCTLCPRDLATYRLGCSHLACYMSCSRRWRRCHSCGRGRFRMATLSGRRSSGA